ncbi:MAG: SAM-dependent chlorinase/fluorinase, partial [Planctomycetes bacterium]|nr:SAM-dependent chlorinase/fluorinase [Planctomycetota bacterium]
TNITRDHLLQCGFNPMTSAPFLPQYGPTKKKPETRNLKLETIIGKESIIGLCASYMDVGKGRPLALFGSTGYLEISINQGNAQKYFKARRESKVKVRIIALTI